MLISRDDLVLICIVNEGHLNSARIRRDRCIKLVHKMRIHDKCDTWRTRSSFYPKPADEKKKEKKILHLHSLNQIEKHVKYE